MKRICLKPLTALVLAFLISACSPAAKLDNKDAGELRKADGEGKTQVKSVRADKSYLMRNGVEIIDRSINDPNCELHYPEIQGLINKDIQDKINNDIKNSVTGFNNESWSGKLTAVQAKAGGSSLRKHSGYMIQGNYNNVLSIRQGFFASTNHFYEEWVITLVYDLNTGNRLDLKDVFVKGADCESLVNSNIVEEIIRKNLDETSLRKPFEGIAKNQEFYITENELVICFNPVRQWLGGSNQDLDLQYREFRIPFAKLGGMADVYDKYNDPPAKLYTKDKLVRKWLPNNLETAYKKLKNKTNRYIMEANYFKISGIEDRHFEDKINIMLEEEAVKFVNDQEFIEKVMKAPLKDGEFMHKIRHSAVTANFAGKLCITQDDHEYIPGNPFYSKRAYCYDIIKGKSFTLKDLLGKYPNYQVILVDETKKQIRKAGYNPDSIRDFDFLAAKAVFYYDENTINLFFDRGVIYDDFFQAVIDLSVLGEDSYKIFD